MAVHPDLEGAVAPQAWRLAGIPAGLCALALVLGWWGTGLVLALLTAANVAFFRNPPTQPPPGEGLVLSPGNGRVVEVAEVQDPGGFVSGTAWRVAIFLSVFDVHINHAPLAGKVMRIRRSGTQFLAAWRPDTSTLNVQNRVDLLTPSGLPISFIQITGLIARRIVCYAKEGDELVRGQPYGLICYGSRMEFYIPARPGVEIRVKVGDRVRSGESVIAEVA
jgi:phosphatidylserine decarboxylase